MGLCIPYMVQSYQSVFLSLKHTYQLTVKPIMVQPAWIKHMNLSPYRNAYSTITALVIILFLTSSLTNILKDCCFKQVCGKSFEQAQGEILEQVLYVKLTPDNDPEWKCLQPLDL